MKISVLHLFIYQNNEPKGLKNNFYSDHLHSSESKLLLLNNAVDVLQKFGLRSIIHMYFEQGPPN